jgi:hypothetical protein
LSIAAAVAFSGAACHSGPRGGREAVNVPVMEASGTFFDAQLTADIRFGRAKLPGRPGHLGDDAERGPSDERLGGTRGGASGFIANAGIRPEEMRMGAADGRGPGGRPREESNGASPAGAPARTGQNPAVQLRLTLTNNSAQSFEVEVLEFSSLLGNFAVHPAKIFIAPRTAATFDPMTSRLGIPQGDLPLKVRLRSGEKTDEQTLMLKVIAENGPGAEIPPRN